MMMCSEILVFLGFVDRFGHEGSVLSDYIGCDYFLTLIPIVWHCRTGRTSETPEQTSMSCSAESEEAIINKTRAVMSISRVVSML